LPLPWRAIGGAVDDQRLESVFGPIPVRNPIGLAAGFDKSCARLDALGRLGFGYVVGGTVTRAARTGNPTPRVVRTRSAGSLVNAMGLPNPGAEAASDRLARRGRGPAPRIVSIADEALDDVISVVGLLAPEADGIELNASCPNVSWGRDRDDEAHIGELVSAIRHRLPAGRPVFVKLPPLTTEASRDALRALAVTAREAGADGLTCGNTRPVEDARLAVGRGGLSGRALWPETLRGVELAVKATEGALSVAACGGVATPQDVVACLEAGASTVQVYTAFVYAGPGLLRELTAGLLAALLERDRTATGLVGSG
jgi:dihydroorotate dehydrogenase